MNFFDLHALDLQFFHWLVALPQSPALVMLASWITAVAPWMAGGLVVYAAFRRPAARPLLLLAVVLCAIASPLAQSIANLLDSPRPFMLGMVPNHLDHGLRGGMPSTHATTMFTLAFMLLRDPVTQIVGWSVALLAAFTGWARIYLGIHFPLDILGGLGLALLLTLLFLLVAGLSRRVRRAREPSAPGVIS